MNLSDNEQASAEVERLLTNWGYWSGQGMGASTHPMFRDAIKRSAGRPVNEPEAMAADGCIARMGEGTITREIIFAVYYAMMYPQDIEIRLHIKPREQSRRLAMAKQQFWDLWRTKHKKPVTNVSERLVM